MKTIITLIIFVGCLSTSGQKHNKIKIETEPQKSIDCFGGRAYVKAKSVSSGKISVINVESDCYYDTEEKVKESLKGSIQNYCLDDPFWGNRYLIEDPTYIIKECGYIHGDYYGFASGKVKDLQTGFTRMVSHKICSNKYDSECRMVAHLAAILDAEAGRMEYFISQKGYSIGPSDCE